jgi:hypothetical protein
LGLNFQQADMMPASTCHAIPSEINQLLTTETQTSGKMNENQKVMAKLINHLPETDRPQHSYIALISMAILSKHDKKILLNEIYDWVVQHFPYYHRRTDKSWRNSIRHNLSLNECFVKVSKAGNGRGKNFFFQ